MALLPSGSFETWISDGNPGLSDGEIANWTVQSENEGTATKFEQAPKGLGNACLNIRSNQDGELSSIGAIISDSFLLDSDYIYYWQKSENSNVDFTIEIYDADISGEPLLTSFSPSIVTQWTLQRIDVSAYKNQNIKIKFLQHTTQEGNGYYTLIDYVEYKDNAGNFQNVGFEDWVNNANPEYWERYIQNGGIAEKVSDPNTGTYASKIRSNSAGNINSIGGFTSHPFYLNNATLKWYQKSQHANVLFTVTLLDRDYNTLVSINPTISVGSYLEQELDVSAYAGQDVCVRIEQHTTQEGAGYYTHIDDLSLSGDVSQTINLSDTLILSDAIELNLSLEKIQEAEILNFSDSIEFLKTADLIEEDEITLSDDIDINLQKNIEESEILSLSDSIETIQQYIERTDIGNYFSMLSSVTSDVDNDIRIRRQELYNIENDIRFIKSWQRAGIVGNKSLGKEYIKVYINSIEQIDVDVDSITITKNLNSAHNAFFVLGRPYDSTKPNQESEIEIKYHIWTLFKGYVSSIIPGDNPDTIQINCQDEYWKQNRVNKYFYVGHEPQDNTELYYNTIAESLSSEFSWSPGIGSFVPQTMDLFGQGSSDVLTSLINNCGNYNWFYHVNKLTGTISKKLQIEGSGNIINLDRQIIGTNLKLYQVIAHKITESIDNLVNKFRVQMGNLIRRRFNKTRGVQNYTSYRNVRWQSFINPSWNRNYETLSGGTGFDLFYHPEDQNEKYSKVFREYYFPTLSVNEEWTDIIPPRIQIFYNPSLTSWKLYGAKSELLTEGFTVDYDNHKVIFNERLYLYKTNENGEMTDVKAPSIRLQLYKTQYYTSTESPLDNPELDITNPLMFFTDKMGDYPTTILKTLNLNQFSIQIGGWYQSGETDAGKPIYTYVPSWDDTDFAQDYANWQLSKVADKQIQGNIDLTIDTMCFYDIDLSNRIMINGILDNSLNIESIIYNIGNWRATITLQNGRYYNRTASLPSHGL